jgi:hypothetical protein
MLVRNVVTFTMGKRLGYETTACMMLIRREINKHMIQEKINKSGLVNDLLLKWYERKLCHHCLGGVVHSQDCPKCDELRIFCDDDKCLRTTRFCDCDWSTNGN